MIVIKQLLCLMHDGCLWLEDPIPITKILIHRNTQLLHSGLNSAMEFGGKIGERDLAEQMKHKFKFVKKPHNYSISSITDVAVKAKTHVLAGKIMRKCCVDEVPTLVVSLVAQCVKGVQFNWVKYLCNNFLANWREAQDHSKTFHYASLLLTIVLVSWELPENSQFSLVPPNLPEATKLASLWATKEPKRVKDSKIFWILMEMSINMAINCKPQSSLTIYDQLAEYVKFKVDFHCVSMCM